MASYNHQFIQFEDKIVKRYTKTIPGMLTGRRLDPHRPENTVEFLLHTPETNFNFVQTPENKIDLVRKSFSYLDEVVELYSTQEVTLFQRMNRVSIENGVLVEYNDVAPDIDTTNMLTDSEVTEIAKTKQLLSINKKLSDLSSIHSLGRILQAANELDRPISIIKAIQSRIDELTTNNNK